MPVCRFVRRAVMAVLAGLSARPFGALAGVSAQTEGDASRLAQLGAGSVEVCGNLKFDVLPSPEKLALGVTGEPGSGRARSGWPRVRVKVRKHLILDAWRAAHVPDALLVLVPRHPQRFNEVADLIANRGLRCQRRSVAMPSRRRMSGWATAWAKWRLTTPWPTWPSSAEVCCRWWAESDRGGGLRLSGAGWSAYLQFPAGHAGCHRCRCGAAH